VNKIYFFFKQGKMEKKHDLMFCPECGLKLDGDEFICSECGYKLAELHPIKKTQEPVTPQPPPVIESPIIPPPPPVIETPVTPPPVAVPNALTFCPDCGVKLEGSELFCNGCGARLSNPEVITEQNKTVPPPVIPPPPSPVAETPITPPVYQNVPPVAQQSTYQQSPPVAYPPVPAKKKGMGAGWWVLIIFLIMIVLGGGTVAFLQYNGNVDLPVARDIIPAKKSQSVVKTTEDHTRYYVVHSFTTIGSKWVTIVSDVICSKRPYNSDEGAKNQFKIAIKNKFPKDYLSFSNSILVNHFSSYPEAVSGHSSYLKNYGSDKRNYEIRTIGFSY
jgi:hypothetical protein